MTPAGAIVQVLTGTGIKAVTVLVLIVFGVIFIYAMYETTLKVKALKQRIVLNELELAEKLS